ncbi:MAG: universal stress protein, partial [Streptosporangiaceae bacterium]
TQPGSPGSVTSDGAQSVTATRPYPATSAEPAPDPLTATTIVIGFDNSGPARHALTWAAHLAATRSAALLVVYSDHVIVDSDLSGFARAEMDTTRDQEATAIEQAATQIAGAAGIGCTFQRLPSAPADAILAAACQAADSDSGRDPLIVVGRSGHAHHVLGSVPVRLQHHSPYPVLTIP